jgi:hypothetical protein
VGVSVRGWALGDGEEGWCLAMALGAVCDGSWGWCIGRFVMGLRSSLLSADEEKRISPVSLASGVELKGWRQRWRCWTIKKGSVVGMESGGCRYTVEGRKSSRLRFANLV